MADGRAYLIIRKSLSYYRQKKLHGKGTDKKTHERTSRLYGRIGPVGLFDENPSVTLRLPLTDGGGEEKVKKI